VFVCVYCKAHLPYVSHCTKSEIIFRSVLLNVQQTDKCFLKVKAWVVSHLLIL
jgi:hypothetical protein